MRFNDTDYEGIRNSSTARQDQQNLEGKVNGEIPCCHEESHRQMPGEISSMIRQSGCFFASLLYERN